MPFEHMTPMGDKVLLKRSELEDRTPGGIIIPDSAKEKAQQGIVIRVGPGKVNAQGVHVPMPLKAGDTVFFGKYAGTEMGNDHIVINENDILGVISR